MPLEPGSPLAPGAPLITFIFMAAVVTTIGRMTGPFSPGIDSYSVVPGGPGGPGRPGGPVIPC